MRVCQDCGRKDGERGKTKRWGDDKNTDDADLQVDDTFCPYAADVHNEPDVAVTLCGKCYQERVWAI